MAKAEILIVEDDAVVAKDIQNRLKNLGFAAPGMVPSGEEAIEKVKGHKPDLVLMDIKLKGEMNGTEAAEQIRSRFNVPVVYLTAYADEKVLERAKATEPFGYIMKPFEDRELNAAIEIALYRYKMEKKLKESQEWLSTTLKSIGDAVIATDKEGHLTFMNPVAESLTGWQQEEAKGKPLQDVFNIINQETRKEVENPVAKVLRDGMVVGLANHTLLISRDGTEIPIDDSGAPIRDEKGEITGVVLVFRDVRERRAAEEEKKRLEAQLQQAQKMEAIGTLAGGIAHDFNNILSAIIGHCGLAKMKLAKDSEAIHNLNEVINAGNRATRLIQQILAFSRMGEQERIALSLTPLIKEALKFLKSTLPTSIEIRDYIEADPGIIEADATQIHQIVINLCTNADHAMREEGGTLDVNLTRVEVDRQTALQYDELHTGPHVRLTVTDTGCGMDPETLEHIFDPYFTTKEVGEGTGLGLSVVHGIVRTHDGTITVESKPGKGTTFHVYFPVIEKDEKIQEEDEGPLPTGSEHILFIDDEPVLVDLAKQMLEHLGYEVTTKSGSLEALELFREQPNRFDLVITDTTMPHMTGDRLAEEFMKIRADIPIILCTGYSKRISKEKAKEMGIKAFVMKPLVMRTLAVTMRKALDG